MRHFSRSSGYAGVERQFFELSSAHTQQHPTTPKWGTERSGVSFTTLHCLVGGRVVRNTRANVMSVAILAQGLLYECPLKDVRRCLGPEHARAPSANGGVGRLCRPHCVDKRLAVLAGTKTTWPMLLAVRSMESHIAGSRGFWRGRVFGSAGSCAAAVPSGFASCRRCFR